jgi:hypothetical protein
VNFLSKDTKARIRIPYALRRVPEASLASLLPCLKSPQLGDIVLTRVEQIGKNRRLELINGRAATLHEGDLLAVVYGNRYASHQFEGHAAANGIFCDLLSMGGLCGLVRSKYATIAEPTKLRSLGAIGNAQGRPLQLGDFALLRRVSETTQPRVIVVCGTSMDAGKTYTAMSLVVGLRRQGERVAAIKLTGTVSGRDTWNLLDAGAHPTLDFVDGGLPSTYLCSLESLLRLYRLLLAHIASQDAEFVVVEIADGLLQEETAALLQSPAFATSVSEWVLATSDPLAATGGVSVLRDWGIEPLAISGLISMSPLAMREARAATAINCVTADELQRGDLNERLTGKGQTPRQALAVEHV